MVFVSLESYIDLVEQEHDEDASRARPRCASLLPLVQVVVTPGCLAHRRASDPSTRSHRVASYSRRRSTSTTTSCHALDPSSPQFVVYVSDRTLQHRWVLSRVGAEFAQLVKTLHLSVQAEQCPSKQCCHALRQVLRSTPFQPPKRRWRPRRALSDPILLSQQWQDGLNALLQAFASQDGTCPAVRQAWSLVDAFLHVEQERAVVAETLVASPSPACARRKQGQDDNMPSSECSICCSSLSHATTSELACGHSFHADCIDVWLRMRACCPTCQVPL